MNESKGRINMRQLEADAKQVAIKHLNNMFQRPGQLEKVEQYKMTLVRKKASVEALLKSGMQSQLDGARIGLTQIAACLQEAIEVENSLKSMTTTFPQVHELCSKLNDVRDENMKHSQYVTARENLKHIFTVPESIQRTDQWINDGRLLHTHQCLRDLENSRDALLYQLHRLPNQSLYDKNMLKDCFKEVDQLSNRLEKEIRFILSRTLDAVRKRPTAIVTALRIIEREEKSDEEALQHEKKNSFKCPGRPKQWKKMAFDVLEDAVATRIEGTQVDEREDNKLWLVRHFEITRQLILEDLRIVKSLCAPCFPPKYHIVDAYVRMYHNCLSKHLEELVNKSLCGNEYVSMLSWVLNTYNSAELMGHPDLKDNTEGLGKLLSDDILDRLQDEYLENMEKNYMEWMQNTLTTEKQDWKSTSEPSVDSTRSAAPVIIYQMIDQNLLVARTISQELTNKAFILSIEQLIKYGEMYKDAVNEYRNKHFEDRSQVLFFTYYMITIVNNCLAIIDIGDQLQKHYWQNQPTEEMNDVLKRLKEIFIKLRNEASRYLLEEVFLDVRKHFDELFTVRWFGSSKQIDTIYATLEDYFQDYNRLVETNLNYIVKEAKMSIAQRYLSAMLGRRISFKNHQECQEAADQIVKEIKQLQSVFSIVAPNIIDDDDEFEAIIKISEILKCEDDMVSFDLHNIVSKYSDITEDNLLRLLYLRGDLNKSDIKEKIAFTIKNAKPKRDMRSSIFKYKYNMK